MFSQEQRKLATETFINLDYSIADTVATLGFDDVISPYSVKGLETLNPDFVDYVEKAAAVTPGELPLVLNIVGGSLSKAEQKNIEETVRDDFAYDLGMVERSERRHKRISLLMVVAMVLVGLLLFGCPFSELNYSLLSSALPVIMGDRG